MRLSRLFKKFRRNGLSYRGEGEIAPDEIFLDASNLPQFDTSQFEGRIVKPVSRLTLLGVGAFSLFILLLFGGRVFFLQISEGEVYAAWSEENRLRHTLLFAERGIVYDRNGEELAWNEVGEEEFARRMYAETAGLSHLLGYIGYPLKDSSGNYYAEESRGMDGVERLYDELLKGSNGLKIVETDAVGAVRSESVVRAPRHGESLTLSIDAGVTEALFRLIEMSSKTYGFSGGSGAIMDVQSGELLALTSYPEYSSQILSDGAPLASIEQYRTSPDKPYLNHVTSGLYTPGSIVKPFIAVGVLEEGVISPEKQILSTGSISIRNPFFPGRYSVFNDWRAHGWVDLRHAIAVSSDVYFYEVGGGFGDQKGIGIDGIDKYLRFFGFGREVGLGIAPEPSGTIPTPAWKAETFNGEQWRIGDTYNTVIGQYGVQVTPLQMVRAIAAIANDGRLLTPKLSSAEPTEMLRLPFREENFEIVKEGMRLAVLEGTAQALAIPTVPVAAKTGTAEVGAGKRFINSWVIGFFPYEAPRYGFVVLMEGAPAGTVIGAPAVMREQLLWMSANTSEYLSAAAR